jgi:hypothetical protein
MSWSQDVVIFVLFPYLLPSLPVCENELWSKDDIRSILEDLLVFYCSTPMKKIRALLQAFVSKVLSISSIYKRNLYHDLSFLADVESRCSFRKFKEWRSSAYSLYVCTSLIEHKVNIHESDCALRHTSAKGYKDIVALLLRHKADIHALNDAALRVASANGHNGTVVLLLEHKADVHGDDDHALIWASQNGHKATVALLLEHKADVHTSNDYALQKAIQNGHKDTVALLLEHKADVRVVNNYVLERASQNGHKDTVALLLKYKSDFYSCNYYKAFLKNS